MIDPYGTAVVISVVFGIRFLVTYKGDANVVSKLTNNVSWAWGSVAFALISGWFSRPDPGRPTSFVIPAILFAMAVSYVVVYLVRNARALRAAAENTPPTEPGPRAVGTPEPGPEGDDGQR